MHIASELSILVFDAVLRTAGAVVFGVVGLKLVRSKLIRNPLDTRGWTQDGPTFVDLLGVVILYMAAIAALVSCVQLDRANLKIPGSSTWHLAQCLDMGAKLLASSLMIMLLINRRSSFVNRERIVSPTIESLQSSSSAGNFNEDAKDTSWPDLTNRQATRGGSGWLGASLGAVLVIFTISYAQLQAGHLIWRWIDPTAIPPVHDVLEAIENSVWGGWGAFHLTLVAVLLAPLSEELFFRGMLLQVFWRYLGQAWTSIVLSAAAFGLIHYTQPQDVIPLISMGVILGYVRMKYNSLTACVVIHSLFNARSMAFVLLNPDLARQAW